MNYSVLSDKAILKFLDEKEIVIEPFNIKNLGTASYDVTLGEWYFREQKAEIEDSLIYNIYSEKDVKRIWGEPNEALPYSYYKKKGIELENIKDDELLIFIKPGETILAHTKEFIGGVNHITTMMKSRSSMGRNFIECCKCAGYGDVSYFNRWTMEITNNSTKYTIPLVVGRRVAQIVFLDVGEINDNKKNYNRVGKYQKDNELENLKKNWKPYDMLPKMYLDFENK